MLLEPPVALLEVYVFRTNIEYSRQQAAVCMAVGKLPGVLRCTVDLEDCDRVLRVECKDVALETIAASVRSMGYFVEEMEGF